MASDTSYAALPCCIMPEHIQLLPTGVLVLSDSRESIWNSTELGDMLLDADERRKKFRRL